MNIKFTMDYNNTYYLLKDDIKKLLNKNLAEFNFTKIKIKKKE